MRLNFFFGWWERAIQKENIAGAVERFGRSEGDRAIDSLSSACHPGSLSAVKRQFLSVHCEKILPEKNPKVLKDVAKSADDWVVFTNGLGVLCHIDDVQHGNGDESEQYQYC